MSLNVNLLKFNAWVCQFQRNLSIFLTFSHKISFFIVDFFLLKIILSLKISFYYYYFKFFPYKHGTQGFDLLTFLQSLGALNSQIFLVSLDLKRLYARFRKRLFSCNQHNFIVIFTVNDVVFFNKPIILQIYQLILCRFPLNLSSS